MPILLPVGEVNASTVFAGSLVPDLGLTSNPDEEFRVYVLASGDRYYVGVEERRFLKQRLVKQAEQRGAHWNKVYKVDGVAYVMPVTHRAAEAYVYYALLAQLPGKAVEKLGGWTQTSTNLSPLTTLLCQEARRNVMGACFTCGSKEHFAYECKAAPPAAPYTCKQCHNVIKVTARGQTPTGPTTAAPTSAAPSAAAAQASSAVEAEAATERKAKRRRVSRASSCLRVRVCGVAYTTLAWYVGNTDPSPHQRKKVIDGCMEKALEMSGGDAKTLHSQAFARAPPGLWKEMLPGRINLPHDWVESACGSIRALKSKGKFGAEKVKLRRAATRKRDSCRGVLWRLEDLERVLGIQYFSYDGDPYPKPVSSKNN